MLPLPEPPITYLHWEDNGALAVVVSALRRVLMTLKLMVVETPRMQALKDKYGETLDRKLVAKEEGAVEIFLQIYQDMIDLEHELACDCRTAILMTAIDIESEVNRFLFFNIGERLTGTIERLNVEQKLEVAHRILDAGDFRGTRPHQAVVEVFKWRDRFAHGKIPGVPGRDLRSIHLESGGAFKPAESELTDTVKLIDFSLVLRDHIRSIDTSDTAGMLADIEEVRSILAKLRNFRFTEDHGVREIPAKPSRTRGSHRA